MRASARGREELVPAEPVAELRLADDAPGAVLDRDRIGDRRKNPGVDLLPAGALRLGERILRQVGPPGEEFLVEGPERFPLRQELANHAAELLPVAAHLGLIGARPPGRFARRPARMRGWPPPARAARSGWNSVAMKNGCPSSSPARTSPARSRATIRSGPSSSRCAWPGWGP